MDRKKVLKWVKALESGKYKQGKERLVSIGENGDIHYCCLGVAACVVEGLEIKSLRAFGLLSQAAFDYGIDIEDFGLTLEIEESLANKNDNKKSFKFIAKWIRKNILKEAVA